MLACLRRRESGGIAPRGKGKREEGHSIVQDNWRKGGVDVFPMFIFGSVEREGGESYTPSFPNKREKREEIPEPSSRHSLGHIGAGEVGDRGREGGIILSSSGMKKTEPEPVKRLFLYPDARKEGKAPGPKKGGKKKKGGKGGKINSPIRIPFTESARRGGKESGRNLPRPHRQSPWDEEGKKRKGIVDIFFSDLL